MSGTVDWAAVRRAFPILGRTVHGKPLRYLDTAATAQRPRAVIEAEAAYSREHNANVHRGIHTLAEEATARYEGCRRRVAAFLGAPDPRGVVLTRNATAAINLVARGIESGLSEGDEIVLTAMEHHANLVPWIELARRRGVTLRHAGFDRETGRLDLDGMLSMIGPRTRLVAVVHVSNVLGTINPVAEIAEAAHAAGARVLVDAAQSVGHMPVAFSGLGADFLVFSAHKCYGPMGLGFLVATPEALEDLEPAEFGGEMIERVELDRATWAEVPLRFEAGTPNVSAAAAFPAALDLLESIGLEAVRAHEIELNRRAMEALSRLDGLRIVGPAAPEARGGLVAFDDPFVHPHDMATIVDTLGVAIRAGHHCAQPLHRALGLVATSRASWGVYTTADDIEALAEAIAFARRTMGA